MLLRRRYGEFCSGGDRGKFAQGECACAGSGPPATARSSGAGGASRAPARTAAPPRQRRRGAAPGGQMIPTPLRRVRPLRATDDAQIPTWRPDFLSAKTANSSRDMPAPLQAKHCLQPAPCPRHARATPAPLSCSPAVSRSDPEWPGVTRSGPEWPGVARSGPEWPGVTRSGPEWPGVARSDPE
eukprot:gene19963-biopygen4053